MAQDLHHGCQWKRYAALGAVWVVLLIAAGLRAQAPAVPPTRAAGAPASPAASAPSPPAPVQPGAPALDTEVIRVSTNLVAVPVSVVDGSGKPVLSLQANDFRVYEEGQPRPIVSLGEPGKTALDLALLFDVSGSVKEKFEFEQNAAAGFLREVWKPSDTISVFSIDAQPRLVQPRTRSLAAAVNAIQSLQPTRDTTAFFDTVVQAAQYLSREPQPGTRRVLVVISDGEDNASRGFHMDSALRALEHTDCIFYSINPSGLAIRLNPISLQGQSGMEQLAANTGEAFLPVSADDLPSVFKQIAAELQAQYLLGFYSDQALAGGFRKIAVMVPTHPGLRVRARRGFYAPGG